MQGITANYWHPVLQCEAPFALPPTASRRERERRKEKEGGKILFPRLSRHCGQFGEGENLHARLNALDMCCPRGALLQVCIFAERQK